MESLNPGYDLVTLAISHKESGEDPPQTAGELVNQYSEVIEYAKNKCKNVIVSSFPPCLQSEKRQEKIDAANAGLLAACNEKENVSLIDVSQMFKLADGTVNDGYIQNNDGNITCTAMNKLASKLKLRIKDKKNGVCKVVHNQKRTSLKTADMKLGTLNGYTNSRNSTARQNMQKHNSNSWCYHCGEGNHVRDRCRYSEPLECHRCHLQGHKSKFCDLYDI